MTETLVVKTLSSPFYESPDMLISDVGNIITFNLISLKPFCDETERSMSFVIILLMQFM